MYLVKTTRADIASAVDILSRFAHNLYDNHFRLINRDFRYLLRSGTKGICFPSKNDLMVRGFSDSDWAGDLDQQKSTRGVSVMMGVSPLCFRSLRQATVAKSSVEAEFVALCETSIESVWLQELLNQIFSNE
jgi:hypothetical protein